MSNANDCGSNLTLVGIVKNEPGIVLIYASHRYFCMPKHYC